MEPSVIDTHQLTPTNWDKTFDPMFDNSNQARFAQDTRLHVQFYLRPFLQRSQSKKENRPVFKDVVHVRIMVPGDKHNIIDRVASIDDKRRFADRFAKFEAGQNQATVGTLLEALPWMTRSKCEEYKFFGILTVEQLATASDQVGQKFPGFQADKRRAEEFLEAASGTSAKVNALESALAEQKKQMEALMAQIQSMQTAEPNKQITDPPTG